MSELSLCYPQTKPLHDEKAKRLITASATILAAHDELLNTRFLQRLPPGEELHVLPGCACSMSRTPYNIEELIQDKDSVQVLARCALRQTYEGDDRDVLDDAGGDLEAVARLLLQRADSACTPERLLTLLSRLAISNAHHNVDEYQSIRRTVTSILANRTRLYGYDAHGRSALHLAAMCGDSELTTQCLALGVEAAETDMFGANVLHILAAYGDEKQIGELAQAGSIALLAQSANWTTDILGRNPLDCAKASGHIAVADLLRSLPTAIPESGGTASRSLDTAPLAAFAIGQWPTMYDRALREMIVEGAAPATLLRLMSSSPLLRDVRLPDTAELEAYRESVERSRQRLSKFCGPTPEEWGAIHAMDSVALPSNEELVALERECSSFLAAASGASGVSSSTVLEMARRLLPNALRGVKEHLRASDELSEKQKQIVSVARDLLSGDGNRTYLEGVARQLQLDPKDLASLVGSATSSAVPSELRAFALSESSRTRDTLIALGTELQDHLRSAQSMMGSARTLARTLESATRVLVGGGTGAQTGLTRAAASIVSHGYRSGEAVSREAEKQLLTALERLPVDRASTTLQTAKEWFAGAEVARGQLSSLAGGAAEIGNPQDVDALFAMRDVLRAKVPLIATVQKWTTPATAYLGAAKKIGLIDDKLYLKATKIYEAGEKAVVKFYSGDVAGAAAVALGSIGKALNVKLPLLGGGNDAAQQRHDELKSLLSAGFEQTFAKIDQLQCRMEERFDRVEAQIANLGDSLFKALGELDQREQARFEEIIANQKDLSEQLRADIRRVEAKVMELGAAQLAISQEISRQLAQLSIYVDADRRQGIDSLQTQYRAEIQLLKTRGETGRVGAGAMDAIMQRDGSLFENVYSLLDAGTLADVNGEMRIEGYPGRFARITDVSSGEREARILSWLSVLRSSFTNGLGGLRDNVVVDMRPMQTVYEVADPYVPLYGVQPLLDASVALNGPWLDSEYLVQVCESLLYDWPNFILWHKEGGRWSKIGPSADAAVARRVITINSLVMKWRMQSALAAIELAQGQRQLATGIPVIQELVSMLSCGHASKARELLKGSGSELCRANVAAFILAYPTVIPPGAVSITRKDSLVEVAILGSSSGSSEDRLPLAVLKSDEVERLKRTGQLWDASQVMDANGSYRKLDGLRYRLIEAIAQLSSSRFARNATPAQVAGVLRACTDVIDPQLP